MTEIADSLIVSAQMLDSPKKANEWIKLIRSVWKRGFWGKVALVLLVAGAAVWAWTKLKPAQPSLVNTLNANSANNSTVIQGNGNTVQVQNSITYAKTHPAPGLPYISIGTLDGHPVGTTNDPHLRWNQLTIRNTNQGTIDHLCCRLQMPEPIITNNIEIDTGAGTALTWKPVLNKMSVNGSAGRNQTGLWISGGSTTYFHYAQQCFYPTDFWGMKASFSSAGDITGIWEVTVDKLPPDGYATVLFYTSNASEMTNYINFLSGPLSQERPVTPPDPNEIRYYAEGEFQYDAGPGLAKQHFFVPINFETTTRKFNSGAVLQSRGTMHVVKIDYF